MILKNQENQGDVIINWMGSHKRKRLYLKQKEQECNRSYSFSFIASLSKFWEADNIPGLIHHRVVNLQRKKSNFIILMSTTIILMQIILA